MTLDPRFICASDLELYLVDKTTGLPLSNGTVTFYSDVNRSTLKPIYTISGNPPNYSFIQLPNPSTLSAVGTFQDAGNNNVVPYYFPYDGDGKIELYYVVVEDADGVRQFIREAWPPNVADTGEVDSANATNYIPNGQFLSHTDVPADPLNDKPFGQVEADFIEIAQGGWNFSRSVGSSAIDNIQFVRYGQFVDIPEASPRYALQIVCSTPDIADIFKQVSVRFMDVNKFSSSTATYTLIFTGVTFNSGSFPLGLSIIKNFGTGGSPSPAQEIPITEFTITGTETKSQFSFNFESNEGTSIGTNNDDYVEIAFLFPTTTGFGGQFTDFALFAGNVSTPVFPVTTERDFLSRSLTPPTPLVNGGDLYLPIVLTKDGYGYDKSIVGNVEAQSGLLSNFTDSISTTTNLIKADGSQYFTNGFSSLGIPFSRLQAKYFNTTLNQPIYGTGADFASSYIQSATDHLFLGTNQFGEATTPTDVNTTFAFFENHPFSSTGYGLSTYQASAILIVAIATTAGAHLATQPNAGTSGFTITVFKNILYTPGKLSFFIMPIAATTLAGKYFTFETLPGPISYYMWFKVDGIGADPAPGGTGIKVELKSTYTIADVTAIVNFALAGKQVDIITTKAASALTAGEHFTFGTTGNNDYYVWYTIDGAGTDPKVLNHFGIKVELLSADTAAQVATKTMAAINKTYFAVPKLQGTLLRGTDPNKTWDLDADARFSMAPTVWGNQIGTLEIDTVISHIHDMFIEGGAATGGVQGYIGGIDVATSNFNWASEPAGYSETRPVNSYVEWLIRY